MKLTQRLISLAPKSARVAIDSFKWITADQSAAYGRRVSRPKHAYVLCVRSLHGYIHNFIHSKLYNIE